MLTCVQTTTTTTTTTATCAMSDHLFQHLVRAGCLYSRNIHKYVLKNVLEIEKNPKIVKKFLGF